jgi:D-alanyl-lipoteichoic acid acyltransferase DltB (MBOAT superfamily)
MLFPTVEFAIFFLVTFAASWAARSRPAVRKALLLIASYVFYSWWDWRFAFLLLECSLANWMLGMALDGMPDGRRRKAILIAGLALNLGVLGFFKYWGFFLSSLNDALLAVGFERDIKVMAVLLPVGVSFFTFQGISYVVDVYRRDMRATTSALDFLLLVAFFPHLVAGPLVRASELLPQLAKPVDPSDLRAGKAFLLIALGLFKKVVIAHYLAVELVNPVFESPSDYGSIDLLFGAYGYAVQIYCDFSAYSDIAIGVALLFGYAFPRNFDQPYRARTLRDFWHRWHISLSSWLRDYLYIPLGGSRGGEARTQRNLFLTMLFGGLWHGAAWNFVLWGALHGGGLCAERWARRRLGSREPGRLALAAQGLACFHFVCLTWIFFNAESFAVAWEYLAAFAANFTAPVKLVTGFSLLLLAIGFIGQLVPPDLVERAETSLARIPLPAQAALLAVAVVVVSAFSPGALAPFIYFRF